MVKIRVHILKTDIHINYMFWHTFKVGQKYGKNTETVQQMQMQIVKTKEII
jgi:hypothetical protein